MPQLLPIAPPNLFTPRPLRVWLVIGLFIVYLIVSYCIFFEAVAPVADFSFRPRLLRIHLRTGSRAAYAQLTSQTKQQKVGADASANLFGPVLEAELLRTDFNVAVFNCLLFIFCLSILRRMPQFDRATFLLLMMINPFLLASMITLNKEIFALAGIVVFIRYTDANASASAGWRSPRALALRTMAADTGPAYLCCYESKISPLRHHRRWGVAVTLLGFTVLYGIYIHLASFLLLRMLAQAKAVIRSSFGQYSG